MSPMESGSDCSPAHRMSIFFRWVKWDKSLGKCGSALMSTLNESLSGLAAALSIFFVDRTEATGCVSTPLIPPSDSCHFCIHSVFCRHLFSQSSRCCSSCRFRTCISCGESVASSRSRPRSMLCRCGGERLAAGSEVSVADAKRGFVSLSICVVLSSVLAGRGPLEDEAPECDGDCCRLGARRDRPVSSIAAPAGLDASGAGVAGARVGAPWLPGSALLRRSFEAALLPIMRRNIASVLSVLDC